MTLSKKRLGKSVDRYLRYVKKLDDDKFEIHGFPINLSTFSSKWTFDVLIEKINNIDELIRTLPDLPKEKSFKFYSLQNNYTPEYARKYWRVKTYCLFNRKVEEIFIFLFDSGEQTLSESKKYYSNNNSTNEDFCHSLLFRDFVKKNKIGFDFDLSICKKLKPTDFEYQLTSKISNINYKANIAFKKDNLINQIIEDFNNYFPKAKLNDKVYKKYLTDFYAYNLNCKAFTDTCTSEKIINDINISDIICGHELHGSVLSKMKGKSKDEDVSKIAKWQIYINIISDLTKILVHHFDYDIDEKKGKHGLKLLLIDDHPEKIKDELKVINKWLPKSTIDNQKNKKVQAKDFDELFRTLEDENNSTKEGVIKLANSIKKGTYDFILIDLDYDGELKGFEYLRVLRRIKSIYSIPYVIVFSRNEDAASVQKALNMGALFFASKQNFAHLLLELFKILPLVQRDNSEENRKDSKEKTNNKKNDDKQISLGQNWSLLYQLPLAKILQLKSEKEKIKGSSYIPYFNAGDNNYGFNKDIENDPEYLWIKKIPKAELHIHIGSVLGHQLIPQTSLLILSQLYNKKNEEYPIKEILTFLLPIASDPYLFELLDNKKRHKQNDDYKNSETSKLKKLLIIDSKNQFVHQSIFTIIIDTLNLKANMLKPEEVLLSPQDETLEKRFVPLSRLKDSDYFKAKLELRKKKVSYEEVMLFFILLLDIRNYITVELKKVKIKDPKKEILCLKRLFINLDEIKNILNKFDKDVIEDFEISIPKNEIVTFIREINKVFINNKIFKEIYQPFDIAKEEVDDLSILKFLISAHSKQRCLHYHNRGLFNYLRGCEYGGAPHLQSKESIYLAAHYIVYKYAIPDKIRYLDLRCAIDGYTKFNLIKTEDEAAKNLLDAFSFWQKKAFKDDKKKVHVNIIVTAKRHKSIKEFEKNVNLTVKNYDDKLTDENKKDSKKNHKDEFWESRSKIVSFDIAGIEKGNRVGKFKNELRPLLLKCVPTTIHAGEEDSHEAIWEAVYEAHVHRLGHALTLVDEPNLMNLVKETRINVELCPVSNYLTNKKFSFDKQNYPLRKYLKNRLSVSINTDNPYVSDTTLSKEFLLASKLSGGFTKWQILKIILYSFKSITIHKNLKSILIKEINEEIFELMLKEAESI